MRGRRRFARALLSLWFAVCTGCGPGESTAGRSDAGEEGGAGARFSELYRDFFGPTGKASCAGDGACHGAPDQPGAAASRYVCGNTASACRTSMVTAGLVSLEGGTPPELTTLYLILRKRDGTGSMPKRPEAVSFTRSDMDRIASWILAGALDD